MVMLYTTNISTLHTFNLQQQQKKKIKNLQSLRRVHKYCLEVFLLYIPMGKMICSAHVEFGFKLSSFFPNNVLFLFFYSYKQNKILISIRIVK